MIGSPVPCGRFRSRCNARVNCLERAPGVASARAGKTAGAVDSHGDWTAATGLLTVVRADGSGLGSTGTIGRSEIAGWSDSLASRGGGSVRSLLVAGSASSRSGAGMGSFLLDGDHPEAGNGPLPFSIRGNSCGGAGVATSFFGSSGRRAGVGTVLRGRRAGVVRKPPLTSKLGTSILMTVRRAGR